MRKNLKDRWYYLGALLLFLAALAVLGYPRISDWLCRYAAGCEIADYEAAIAEEDAAQLAQAKEDAARYNEMLGGEQGPVSVADYNDLLSVADAIGYLEIPRLDVWLPIYHGLGEDVLERGIGHMPDTSLPVGGPSTHCVLSGHTGLPSARLLTGLDQMEEGDLFYIHVLDEVLAYRVDQIRVVLPEDTSELGIKKGEDYVTLLTCTPYGVNSHRLLVRGSRTEYVQEEAARNEPPVPVFRAGPGKGSSPETLLFCAAAAAGAIGIAAIGLILFLPARKKRGKKE